MQIKWTTKNVDVLRHCTIWGGGGPIFLEKIGAIYTKNDDAFMIFVTWYETKDVDGFIYNNLFYSVAHKLLILRQNAIFTYISMHILMFENCTERLSFLRLVKCSKFLK